MALSGAIAGIGGASQDGDFRHPLDPRGLTAAAYGYTGIVIAALARYNPFAVVLVAFLLGGLQNAGLHAAGRRLPVRARRRDAGPDPLLHARRRGARPLPDPARPPRAAGGPGAGDGGVNNSILVVVLASAVAYGTPLLYAALGELLAERSGVLNLGVEGMMLVGAVMGFWAVQRIPGSGPAVLAGAVAVAAIAGAAMALIHAFLVDHAAREPDRLRARADDLRRRGRALVLPRQRPQPRRRAGDAPVHRVPAGGLARRDRDRADPVRPERARLRLVGPRRDRDRSTWPARGPG